MPAKFENISPYRELFLKLATLMICSFNATLFMLIPGKHGINYYICLGINPEVDPYNYEKVKLYRLLQGRLGLILLIFSEQSARLVVDRVLFSDLKFAFTLKFA